MMVATMFDVSDCENVECHLFIQYFNPNFYKIMNIESDVSHIIKQMS